MPTWSFAGVCTRLADGRRKMEDMIAITVSEYERLKAAEKRLNELRQEQIDKVNQEIEEIKRRSHEKMMQSFAAVPGVPPVFL